MMFGFASNEMDNYMPMPIEVAHILLQELAAIRKEGKKMKYLRPDAKSQVTIEYDENNQPVRIDTIVISTQHDEFDSDKKMQETDQEGYSGNIAPPGHETYPCPGSGNFSRAITGSWSTRPASSSSAARTGIQA